jgi:leucyl-tRNA synthetase
MVVQVNGKVSDRLQVPADISEDAVVALAASRVPVAKILAGKPPRKVIYVPQKLVKIVP